MAEQKASGLTGRERAAMMRSCLSPNGSMIFGMSATRSCAAGPAPTRNSKMSAASMGTPTSHASVKRISRGDAEELRVHVSVFGLGLLARLNPLAEQVLLATPDGEMVGEYTLASEGNDPRRYQMPRGTSRGS